MPVSCLVCDSNHEASWSVTHTHTHTHTHTYIYIYTYTMLWVCKVEGIEYLNV